MIQNRPKEKVQSYYWKMLIAVTFLFTVVLPLLFYYKVHFDEYDQRDSSLYLINAKEAEETALNFQSLTNQKKIEISFQDQGEILPNAQITNNIVDRRIYITFPEKMSQDISSLLADDTCVDTVYCSETENGTTFVFVLKDYYEASIQQNLEKVEIQLESIRDVEQPLIVLELYDTTPITVKITDRIAQQLTIAQYHVCITGNEQRTLTSEQRISFANDLNASAYLQIGMAPTEADGEAKTTAVCNPDYFIPYVNSIALADCVEYHTVEQLGGVPGGVVECEEDNILRMATIPACTILLGYQASESGVLSTTLSEYGELAAQGITDGILEALTGEDGD